MELRIAFDFDGVIADDASERVYKSQELEAFHEHETSRADVPHSPGPLADLFRKLSLLQQLEDEASNADPDYQRASCVPPSSPPAASRPTSGSSLPWSTGASTPTRCSSSAA